MPHQCVRCGKIIEDGSRELLTGCSECGSRFFFYIKKGELEKGEIVRNSLSKTDVSEMEKDVRELMGIKKQSTPVILNLETVRAISPGKFRIDVSALMRGEPVVINISDGKYYIDLPSAFKKKGSAELLKHLK